MKKLRFSAIAVAAMMAVSCGTGFTTTGTGTGSTGSILGDVISGAVNGGAIDAIASIIGATNWYTQNAA